MYVVIRMCLSVLVISFSCQAMTPQNKALKNLYEKNAVIKNSNDRHGQQWAYPISEQELSDAFDQYPIINALFNGNLQDLTAALYKTTFSVDKSGRNILHYLMCIQDPWNKAQIIMSYAEKNKIDINAQDKNGRTPFHYAVLYANITGVILLQNVQACPWIKDSGGKNAVDYLKDGLNYNEVYYKIFLNRMSQYIRTSKTKRYSIKNGQKNKTNAEYSRLAYFVLSLLTFESNL